MSAEFGKGFEARNLDYTRSLYQIFPIWNALSSKLSWTHYRRLLRVEDETQKVSDLDNRCFNNFNPFALSAL
ncbi:DUF1016 N-terminal domain-containing protein [Nitrincola nitratireducens]|uniref:DUF1016 N-terminal domain-containing protein n=1 Tax=Nitrincola nitratireducens TaxID=1229521 RepID=UPI0009DEA3EE